MIFDVKSAKVNGAESAGRARVVYLDGKLMGFNRDGKMFEVESEKPTRRKGYIRAWEANTAKGVVTIDETCWTCNGWLPMAMKSIEDLIGGEQPANP